MYNYIRQCFDETKLWTYDCAKPKIWQTFRPLVNTTPRFNLTGLNVSYFLFFNNLHNNMPWNLYLLSFDPGRKMSLGFLLARTMPHSVNHDY